MHIGPLSDPKCWRLRTMPPGARGGWGGIPRRPRGDGHDRPTAPFFRGTAGISNLSRQSDADRYPGATSYGGAALRFLLRRTCADEGSGGGRLQPPTEALRYDIVIRVQPPTDALRNAQARPA